MTDTWLKRKRGEVLCVEEKRLCRIKLIEYILSEGEKKKIVYFLKKENKIQKSFVFYSEYFCITLRKFAKQIFQMHQFVCYFVESNFRVFFSV